MGLLSGLFGGNKGTILTESPAGKKQDFLEASPYWDQSTVPVNTFKNKSPYTAKVVSCKRIVGPEATGETCHIIFDHKGNMPYWEGQSYGVIPPGTNPKNGKPHTVRLYSIASSRYGDNMAGKTSSLCVRRATYWDPDMGKEDPAKKGVCSNFLCDATAGEQVKMTVRSRRPAVLRRLHAIDAHRLQERMSWLVSFPILGPFGPRRVTAMLRAGQGD